MRAFKSPFLDIEITIVSYFVRWTFTKEQRKKIRESPKLVCFLGYPMKSVGCDVATTTQSPWGKIQ